ncbi:hypothetical protein OH76DRAFT_1246882 [Lentinus brumalis]|uniref:Uncharacterized protein n=1 Tax=Lentinus brumalis TaxID=2498619 RepID=A0A371CRU4_9APHY|nr:hypothetical protein OH76DRAFT_1246882 [Polyporus brumalis]
MIPSVSWHVPCHCCQPRCPYFLSSSIPSPVFQPPPSSMAQPPQDTSYVILTVVFAPLPLPRMRNFPYGHLVPGQILGHLYFPPERSWHPCIAYADLKVRTTGSVIYPSRLISPHLPSVKPLVVLRLCFPPKRRQGLDPLETTATTPANPCDSCVRAEGILLPRYKFRCGEFLYDLRAVTGAIAGLTGRDTMQAVPRRAASSFRPPRRATASTVTLCHLRRPVTSESSSSARQRL